MGVFRIKKNIFHMSGFEPPINQPVEQPLYRLHNSGSMTIEARIVKKKKSRSDMTRFNP